MIGLHFKRISSSVLKGNALFASSLSNDKKEDNPAISTEEKIIECAKGGGVDLSISTLGPGYRAVARASHDPEQILGYCEGFIRPGALRSNYL